MYGRIAVVNNGVFGSAEDFKGSRGEENRLEYDKSSWRSKKRWTDVWCVEGCSYTECRASGGS